MGMVKLYKKQVTINEGKQDEKSFYTFYLQLENGSQLRIQPNKWVDANKKTHSNYNELCLIASDELPFDK